MFSYTDKSAAKNNDVSRNSTSQKSPSQSIPIPSKESEKTAENQASHEASRQPKNAERPLKISAMFPDYVMTNEDNRQVRFYSDVVKNHIVMINFIFTKCQKFCPMETARLKRVQKALGERMGQDIRFISVSIDPKFDSPEILAEYKKKFQIGPGWTFLTGNEDEIKNLRTRLGLLSKNFPQEKNDHSLDILVGNEATGKWMRRSSMDSPGVLAKLIGENLANWSQLISKRIDFSEAPLQARKTIRGEDIFRNKCSDCHSIGGGDSIGPDLHNISLKRDKEWLVNWIKNPDEMLAKGDSTANELFQKFSKLPMPNLGITDSEVDDILFFISTMSSDTADLNKGAL